MIFLLNSTKTMAADISFPGTPRPTKPRQMEQAKELGNILSPLDLIEFYRLEMGAKVQPAGCKNLAEYWRGRLTQALNVDLKKCEPVISVAAQEYVKALHLDQLKGLLTSAVFKEQKPDGTLKTVAVHSKMARGALVKYALESGAREPQDLLGFAELGWEAAEEPPERGAWLFTRPARGND